MNTNPSRRESCINFWKQRCASLRAHVAHLAESGESGARIREQIAKYNAILTQAEKHLKEAIALPDAIQDSPESANP